MKIKRIQFKNNVCGCENIPAKLLVVLSITLSVVLLIIYVCIFLESEEKD